MPGERENGSLLPPEVEEKASKAEAGGSEAGADEDGLSMPDVAPPGCMVGEARPAGNEAASIEVSAVDELYPVG